MRYLIIAVCVAGLMACEEKSPEGASTSEKIQSATEKAHEAVDAASAKATEWSQQFDAQMTDWSAKIEEIAREAQEKGSAKATELANEAKVTYEQARDKLAVLGKATADERAAIQDDLTKLGEHIVELYEQAKTALTAPAAAP